jgi:hypothetical protein
MTDDFRDDPAFLRDEAIQQAALATGAMREANALRQQLRGAIEERDVLALALTMATGSSDVRESCVRQARAALAQAMGESRLAQ